MYQIISMTGEILCETDLPIYSKFNPANGTWISANEFDAECVVVNGKRCIIYGKPFAADSKNVVFVKKVDAAQKVQKLSKETTQISADNLDIMEALVELDRKLTALNQSLEASKNG